MSQYISLGGNCAVSYALRENDLRDEAYPFDWCQISINQLITILKANFADFQNVSFVRESDHHPLLIDNIDEINPKIDKGGSYILTNKYKLKIAHEIYDKIQIPAFCSSLERRIERFKSVENPTFIRLELQNISEQQTQLYYKVLDECLKIYFGDNFKLILISKYKYESSNIQWIKLNEFSPDWKYPNVKWKEEIFTL